jgi:hypothetical protein
MNQDVLPNESTTQKKNLIFYLSDQALFVTRVLVRISGYNTLEYWVKPLPSPNPH